MGFYAASKHALEGLAESLDHETRTLGIRAAYDMKPSDIRRACELVEEHCDLLFAKWREIHG